MTRLLLHLAILAVLLLATRPALAQDAADVTAIIRDRAAAHGLWPFLLAQQSCTGRVTGYASSQFPGLTATGMPTRGNEWTIAAVDPRLIPLGSSVYVEGLGTFLAADTGGGVRGCWVDVLVYTVAEAYALTSTRTITWW